MESRRKRSRSQLLKWGCYVLALFVCAALQTTPGLFQLGQAKPLLVLPLCLAVAVFEGEFAGALLGTVGGLLWDYAAGLIAENEEYCIVADDDTFGLAQYDHIALDADTVSDDQLL